MEKVRDNQFSDILLAKTFISQKSGNEKSMILTRLGKKYSGGNPSQGRKSRIRKIFLWFVFCILRRGLLRANDAKVYNKIYLISNYYSYVFYLVFCIKYVSFTYDIYIFLM
jgi:hypothetical protein